MSRAEPITCAGHLRSVLYVDDDPDICEVVQATLCLVAGISVDTAESGKVAIDLAYELRPDLILMDVMMPGLDGPSTLKRMRDGPTRNQIPIIFLTAKILPAEVAHFLHLGAIGVIGKPFDPLKLGDDVVSMWNRRHLTAGIMAMQGGPANGKRQVDSLTDGFLRRTDVDVLDLSEMLGHVRAGDWSVLKEVERTAHSIHGAGAMFGFPLLSAVAGMIERLVREVPSNPAAIEQGESVISRLASCIEQLAKEVKAARLAAAVSDFPPHTARSAARTES